MRECRRLLRKCGVPLALGLVLLGVATGCRSALRFPAAAETRHGADGALQIYDVDDDGQADFWAYQNAAGRKDAIAYATAPGEPGPRISLDDMRAEECPHFVIVLDGVPFELVEQLYQEGHFRFFYPPARVISCYPSMTDLALADMFHAGRCLGFQALYYDRLADRLSNANGVYLSGRNAPWVGHMDYRCSFWWDTKVYLDPQSVFDHEIKGILDTFGTMTGGEGHAYSVGTAGLGTRGGRDAIRTYLETLDRLCAQLIHQRRGKVKITLTADHGHNLVPNRRVKFDDLLAAHGFRVRKSLDAPRDVVPIEYGLVTYAAFYTNAPADVAACLVAHDDVEFVCYPLGRAVVVQNAAGLARIRRDDTGYYYDASDADPLGLAPILAELREADLVHASGALPEDVLFAATARHVYPAPLQRIWAAFHDHAEHPPDVIANLRDGACHGSGFFHAMIGDPASTHGSLNRANSTTFALTMLGELPAALPARDLVPLLRAMRTGPLSARRAWEDPGESGMTDYQ